VEIIAGQELGPSEIKAGRIGTLVLVNAVRQRAEGRAVQHCRYFLRFLIVMIIITTLGACYRATYPQHRYKVSQRLVHGSSHGTKLRNFTEAAGGMPVYPS
jgi:hypothetical protein